MVKCLAHRSSKGKGIILKRPSLKASLDLYFNVELLSNFPSEQERLFGTGYKLSIYSILMKGIYSPQASMLMHFKYFQAYFRALICSHLQTPKKFRRPTNIIEIDCKL